MVQDTDKILKDILAQNPGIPITKESYVYWNNKEKPVHKGFKDLQHHPRNDYTAIAIRTYENDYLCIDFDGYSKADDESTKQKEKTATAQKIKDNFIELLSQETTKYRIDKTASGKFHVWLKHPNVPNKEFLKLPKFLSKDGKDVIPGIVEIFGKFDKHFVHLAGSKIIENDKTIAEYENVYAGASFDELEIVDNVIGLLISAITSAEYVQKIDKVDKKSNTKKYHFMDARHNGFIKEFNRQGKYYFSYLENDIDVSKHFYIVSKNDFSIDHIMEHCQDEFKSIISSIYYYHESNDDNVAIDDHVINQEISKQLIEIYAKYWNNTKGQRHYLILATSHVLVKYLNFINENDLYYFFDELANTVDEIDYAHRNVILEGLKSNADKEYGIPTIIDILQCDKQELRFLAKTNNEIQNELEYIERIKPTITDEIKADEKKFRKLQELQLNNHYDGKNTYIRIKPTSSITELIAQILGNSLKNEKNNIAKLLLALTGAVIGTNRTYIIVSGVSSAGKSALVKTVKQAIPGIYKSQIDDLSDKAFTRHTEDKGKYAYNRIIIDYGDKGNIKGYEKAIDEMARFQNLISEGYYNYRVTDNDNNNPNGTKDLLIVTDGFAQIITTTKDVLARIDEQIITRSEILYVDENSKDEISDFNAKPGIVNIKNQVNSIVKLIQSHMLYNLNKYDDTSVIINFHWRQYITRLLKANNGVNREIDATMNALKSYCWLEIDRLHQVKGNDDKVYYIPASDIVDDFIKIYGVKSNKNSATDVDLINEIKKEYEPIDDEPMYDGYDLNSKSIRKELNVFTYHDIDALLKKDENLELHKRINNISDVLRKLEKNNILARLSDKANNNVVYYIKSKSLSYNKELDVLSINDDDINYAINHLKNHEVIADENDDTAIYGKAKNKFADSIDFSFIDQRTKENINPENDSNDDNDDSDNAIDTDITTDATNIASSTIAIQTDTSNTNSKANIDETLTSKELVNLHCHTDESVGDGAISIEQLIDTAIQHNQKAVALTNHGTMNGLYRFNKLCNKKGIKAILGIEAYISSSRYHLILLAKNYQGYQDLLKLHNKNVEYMKSNGLKRNDRYVNGGIYYSNLEQEKELCKNLICLSGCISGEIPQLLLNGEYEQAKALAIRYNSIFNRFYLELQYNGLKEQETLNEMLIELSSDTGIPLTVTGDVHYISNKDDWRAIKSTKNGRKIPASNNAFMTKAPSSLAESTIDIADSISVYDIQTSLHIPKPKHNRKWLKEYCYQRLKELDIDDAVHRKRLEKELTVIKDEIADYHILLYEIVESIKDVAGVPGGRGSAVGSLVCYLLGFHEVDPLKYDLLFERFLNIERIQKAIESDSVDTSLLPDIDLNIADDKKDEVFAVLEKEYKYIAKVMTYSKLKADNKTIEKIKSLYPTSDVIDLKYNLSIHAGGIILSTEPFNEYLPVTLTKDNEIVSDCDLAEIESRGGIKYDLLSESSSKINKGIKIKDNEINQLVKYIVQHPLGISQFTGYTARKYLKENQVTTFDDLLKAIALIRPGSNEKNNWIFQEDMMQEAVKYGITMADADFIRKPRGTNEQKTKKLNQILETMKKNGCNEQKIKIFKDYHNNYSFPKAHAVGYVLESLKNAKLKKYDTALFFEKKLNHAKDSITIAELFDDAIKLGVEIIPPGYKYYRLDAKADGNKLYVGSKFINGIKSKEPISKGKCNNKYFKIYLNKSKIEKLYSIGTYYKDKLPKEPISLGYKTKDGNVRVATISSKGFYIMWFEESKYYKPKELFDKGAIITDAVIEQYASI